MGGVGSGGSVLAKIDSFQDKWTDISDWVGARAARKSVGKG